MADEHRTDNTTGTAKAQSQEPLPYVRERPPVEPEKHDLPAMMCSAYLILLPACLVAILLICLAGYFFVVR